MSNQKLKTAVLPVAGLGSRFLPITKSIPKEMLPIIDKPLIQFAIEEAIEAGIEKIVFVTSHTKKAIEDYFSINSELEKRLIQSNKENLIEKIHPKYFDKVDRYVFTVSKGDYLGKISLKFNCKIEEIKKWNNLKTDKIFIGQKLVLYVRPDLI